MESTDLETSTDTNPSTLQGDNTKNIKVYQTANSISELTSVSSDSTNSYRDSKRMNIDIENVEDEASYSNLVNNNKSFRLFILSYFATMSGEWFNYIASITVIQSLQPDSYLSVSLLMLLRLIPNLLSILGGTIADSYDKRQSMMKLNILSSIIAIQFLIAYQYKSIILLYLVTFLQSALAAFYEPIRMSFIPLLVTNDEYLKKATTMTSLVWSVMAAFGAGIGGFVSAYVGVQACFILDTLSYLISAILLYNIGGTWDVTTNSSKQNSFSDTWYQFLSMSKDGVNYMKTSFFGPLLLVKGTGALIFGSSDILNVTFSKVDNESDSIRLGILFSCVGLGCLVGPLIVENFTTMKYLRSLQYACILGFGLMAVSAFGMGYYDIYFICTCIFTVVRALGSSTLWVNSSILLQKFCNINMLGRISSLDYTFATICEAMSVLFAGILLDACDLNPNIVCYIFGILGFCICIFWIIFDRKGGGAAHELSTEYEEKDEYVSLL